MEQVIDQLALVVFIIIVLIVAGAVFREDEKFIDREGKESKEQDKKASPEELQEKYGEPNMRMSCPHCSSKETIRTKLVHRPNGISGPKLLVAAVTLGLSMFATGLSRMDRTTQAHCEHCVNTWHF